MEENNNPYNGEKIKEGTTKDQYFTFVIDQEEYGIEIENIKEIISICRITRVPETPVYLKGIINLRGDIIPVIDVRARFLKDEKEYDELTCIVVIEHNSQSLGLIVDQVKEVMFIDEKNVTPPPNAKLNFRNQFIKNIGMVDNEAKLILNLDKVI
jgi:purine-binding chemotaxis protein CheW